jgi:hypothetical protein
MERFLRQIDEMEKMKNEVMESLHETQSKVSVMKDEISKGFRNNSMFNVENNITLEEKLKSEAHGEFLSLSASKSKDAMDSFELSLKNHSLHDGWRIDISTISSENFFKNKNFPSYCNRKRLCKMKLR